MKITTCMRRRHLHFRWYTPGSHGKRIPRYRKVIDASKLDDERVQLAADLISKKQDPYIVHRRRPLLGEKDSHLADFSQAMRAGAVGKGEPPAEKHCDQVMLQITRVLTAAKIVTIDQLDPTKVKTAIASLRRCLQTKKKKVKDEVLLAPRSRNMYLGACKQFAKWLFAERRTAEDLLARAKNWSEAIGTRHPRARLEPDELVKLLRAAEQSTKEIEAYSGPLRAKLYLVAAATGLRRKELSSLQPASFADLDGECPIVQVLPAYTKNKKLADLPLQPALVAMLKLWLPTLGKHEPLFPDLEEKKTVDMVRGDLKAAGVPYQNEKGEYRDFHAIRHTHISMVWEIPGITAREAQAQARHSTLALTMRYSHVRQGSRPAERLALPRLCS